MSHDLEFKNQDKVAELLKTADLYDLIRISMRSSNNKLSAVDRYIKRAIDRQSNSVSVNDENSSIVPQSPSKYKINMFQVEKSEYTESQYVESPIKEVLKGNRSVLCVDNKFLRQSQDLSNRKSVQKNPLTETQTINLLPSSPTKSMKEQSIQDSPLRQRKSIVQVVEQTKENLLDECKPPSPHKKQPSPVRQSLEKPIFEVKLNDQSKIPEEENETSQLEPPKKEETQNQEIEKKDLAQDHCVSPNTSVRARYFQQTISSQNKKKGFGNVVPDERENSSSKKNFSSFNRSVSSNLIRPDEQPTTYNLTSPQQPLKKVISRQCSAHRGVELVHKSLVSPVLPKTQNQESQKVLNSDLNLNEYQYHTKKAPITTYDDLTSKQAQKVAQQYIKKPQNNKQKLMSAFQTLNLNLFIEMERIKKPQKHALWTGRMLCLLVSILREKPVNDNFNSWESVVSFVNGNISRFTQDVLSLQKKLIDQTYMHNYEKLQYLYNEYFAHTKIQTFKNHIANKNLRTIAHFVYTVLCYVLGKDEEHFTDDISQIKEDTANTQKTSFDDVMSSVTVRPSEKKVNTRNDNSPLLKFAQTMTQVPQSTRNANASQRVVRNNNNKKVSDTSPFRLPKKNKFLPEPVLEKHRQNNQQNLQSSVLRSKQGKKDSIALSNTTPLKDKAKDVSKSRCQTPVPVQTMQKKKGPLEPQVNETFSKSGRQSLVPVTQRASYKRDSQSFKASPLKKEPVHQEKEKVQPKKQEQPKNQSIKKRKEPSQDLVNIELKKETTESVYEFSPNKIRSAINQGRKENKDNLIEQAQKVEQNLNLAKHSKKEIDLSIIEDLKRRRSQNRRTPFELEQRREQIIQQVQSQIFKS